MYPFKKLLQKKNEVLNPIYDAEKSSTGLFLFINLFCSALRFQFHLLYVLQYYCTVHQEPGSSPGLWETLSKTEKEYKTVEKSNREKR